MAARVAVVACLVASTASATSSAPPLTTCGTGAACHAFAWVSPTSAFMYDLCPLCQPAVDYTFAVPSTNLTFVLNVLGNVSAECLPQLYEARPSGAGVVFFGPVPECTPPGACTDAAGQPACCTANCEVIGLLPGSVTPLDAANPATGGVLIEYGGVSSSPSDPFQCPYDPKTGLSQRTLRMELECDPKAPSLAGLSVEEASTCVYKATGRAAAACGMPFTPPPAV
jgi:hypothetical protein